MVKRLTISFNSCFKLIKKKSQKQTQLFISQQSKIFIS